MDHRLWINDEDADIGPVSAAQFGFGSLVAHKSVIIIIMVGFVTPISLNPMYIGSPD